ncbi:hypothetical protein TNCV_920661 [Trichonephila clavipes]|nr:hypothetical protein TNCV_920661 [Trichonephila clavipes]
MLNERTELHVFDKCSVHGDGYCKEVVLSHVHLFRGTIGTDADSEQTSFLWMKKHGHTGPKVQQLLKS